MPSPRRRPPAYPQQFHNPVDAPARGRPATLGLVAREDPVSVQRRLVARALENH